MRSASVVRALCLHDEPGALKHEASGVLDADGLRVMRADCPGAMVFKSSGRAGRESGSHGNLYGLLPSGLYGND
jgi:hypothetical protein